MFTHQLQRERDWLHCNDDLSQADERDLESRQTFFEKRLEQVKSALNNYK